MSPINLDLTADDATAAAALFLNDDRMLLAIGLRLKRF